VKYYVVVKTNDPEAYTLLTDHEGAVRQFDSQRAGLRYFEDAYDQKHRQSFEGSMSACIHAIFFRPAVVGFESLGDLGTIVQRDEDGAMHLVSMRNNAGSIWGIPCKRDDGRATWEKGAQPRIVG
jgi:hypothetical protein